jgi:hypothetical protein
MRRNDIYLLYPDMALLQIFLLIQIWEMPQLTTVASDINALILDYLTMEGYPNAAEKFSKEANLQPQQDVSCIRARQAIQNCIHSGNIQSAIETLNELDPEVSILRSAALMRIFSCAFSSPSYD